MMHFTRGKTMTILLICLAGFLACVPNFLSDSTFKNLPKWAQHRIGLGLDLRGGAHLLLAMDSDQLRKDWMASLRDDARKQLRDGKIGFTGITPVGNTVQVRLAKPEDSEAALTALKKLVQNVGVSGATDVTVAKSSDPGLITVEPTEAGLLQRVSDAASASIETIRRRIDPAGTVEPNIVRQGRDRILVQVPGVENTAQLIEILGKTAKLSFHEVHPDTNSLVGDGKDFRAPSGFKVYQSDPSERGAGAFLLRETPEVSGDQLTNAQVGFEQYTNRPLISFRLNQVGARKFGDFTRKNVGQPFAIVLDDKVLSAPTIQSVIDGGSGQITGNYTADTANTLAIQLRSGALPSKLTVLEERTVGANLGQDSIDAGKRAAIVGMIAVAGFMIFAYGLLGVFAVIGAALHVVLVFGIMSLLGSTMTLPGIAGIVLTIGMAVDANVLIYERIREELRAGKAPILAIEAGFERAYGTIIDSQLTTFIAGMVMFLLGSGPIRGFAVTLTLGIITTVFTAFTVTRLLVSWWLGAQKTRKIDAPLAYKMVRT
jgi:protein-export membrane protein SecD